MGVLEDLQATLDVINEQLSIVNQRLMALEQRVTPKQVWYTKKDAAALKGVRASTLDADPWLWPNHGKAIKIGKTYHFWHEDVLDWLSKTDEQLWIEHLSSKNKSA